MTGAGLLATAAATTYLIKTGASAGMDDSHSAPRTVVATIAPSAPRATPQAAALERPVLVSAPAGVVQAPVDLRQVVYTIAGNQRPDDPVTVIYADETGTLQTLTDVTLPWTLTVKPDLPVNYLYAKSRGSQLNCWIADAGGSTVVSRTDYGPTTSCNR